MFKWLIAGLVVVLVSHWSSKEVHADSPLTNDEKRLLSQLRKELDESSNVDGRSSDCFDLCDDLNDEECFEDCMGSIATRMLEQDQTIEETRAFDGQRSLSKKAWGRRRGWFRRTVDGVRRFLDRPLVRTILRHLWKK